MRTLFKLTWVEIKLFIREPITVVFTLALPMIFLVVMGGVFGNEPSKGMVIYRGVGAMDYYMPSYYGLVMMAIGTVALPVHRPATASAASCGVFGLRLSRYGRCWAHRRWSALSSRCWAAS